MKSLMIDIKAEIKLLEIEKLLLKASILRQHSLYL